MALRTIDQPSNFRSGINTGGTDIGKNLILKVDTANLDGVLLAVSATAAPIAGVTTEVIQAGTSRSYQRGGKTVVTAGAAVAIGDGLVSDGAGRAIKGTLATAGNQLLGRAVTAAAALGDLIEVELGASGLLA